jgi:hypothetical protein
MTAIASSSILSLSPASPATTGDASTQADKGIRISKGLVLRQLAQKTSAADENAPAATPATTLARLMLRPPTRPRPSLPHTGKRQDLAAGNAALPRKLRPPPNHDGHPARLAVAVPDRYLAQIHAARLAADASGTDAAGQDATSASDPQRLCSPIRPPWSWQTCCHAAADRHPGHHAARRHHFAPSQTGTATAGTTLATSQPMRPANVSIAQNLQAMAAALPAGLPQMIEQIPAAANTLMATPATQPSTTQDAFPKRPRPRPLVQTASVPVDNTARTADIATTAGKPVKGTEVGRMASASVRPPGQDGE